MVGRGQGWGALARRSRRSSNQRSKTPHPARFARHPPRRSLRSRGEGKRKHPRPCANVLVTLALISGIGLGSMYGLLALGFYVTYAVSNTVNFAQGSSMMLGAVLAYTFAVTWHWHPFLAILF